jgi:hypothetical protein
MNVKYRLETSEHGDGWCSGSECEYNCTVLEHTIPMNESLFGNEINHEDLTEAQRNYIEKYIPEPKVDGGSGYCQLSEECKERGLTKHDYRITILNIS